MFCLLNEIAYQFRVVSGQKHTRKLFCYRIETVEKKCFRFLNFVLITESAMKNDLLNIKPFNKKCQIPV